MRLVAEATGECLLATDAEGRIVEWTGNAESAFGCSREAAIGKPLSDLLAPREPSREVQSALESELRHERLISELIVNSIGEGILGFDTKFRVTLWNPAMERITGLKGADVLAEDVFDAVPCLKESGESAHLREALAGRTAFSGPCPYSTAENRRRGFCEIGYGPILDQSGLVTGGLAVFCDTTERRRIEEERNQLRRDLFEAEKLQLIGRLTAGVLHEVRNPMSFILSNLGFLKKAMGHVERFRQGVRGGSLCASCVLKVEELAAVTEIDDHLGEIPEAIDESLEGAVRVQKIVGNMRGRVHAPEETRDCDLRKVVEDALAITKNEWKYVADVSISFDPQLPLVPGHPDELGQVLVNLIVNAAQAIENVIGNDRKNKGTIAIAVRRTGDWVDIGVRDTGGGIPDDVAPRIFERFFTTKESGKGTGQGLAIARSIVVERHGGTLSFETEPGRGTTFLIRLPSTAAPAERERTVLIVDDDKDIRDTLSQILTSEGYIPVPTSSGSEALAYLRQHPGPCVILLDLQMPAMNGWEFGRQLRDDPALASIPVIVISANPEMRNIAAPIRALAFLEKPFRLEALRNAMKEACAVARTDPHR